MKQEFNETTNNTSAPKGASDSGHEEQEASQLLPKKAEDYLREAGTIEDMPDEEDEAQKDEVLKDEKC